MDSLPALPRGHVPSSHAVLAIDVVRSSHVTDDRLDNVKDEIEHHLARALGGTGLDLHAALQPRETGDGVLLAYPEHSAGRLVELVYFLDHELRWRNREQRFPLRARIAVHCGPIQNGGRYHRPYIVAARLLDAPLFTGAVTSCHKRDPFGDKLGAALVMSRWVWQNIVEPFRVPAVPPGRCAEISVPDLGYVDSAWIHLPGLDAEAVLADVLHRDGAAEDSGPVSHGTRAVSLRRSDEMPPVPPDLVPPIASPLAPERGAHPSERIRRAASDG